MKAEFVPQSKPYNREIEILYPDLYRALNVCFSEFSQPLQHVTDIICFFAIRSDSAFQKQTKKMTSQELKSLFADLQGSLAHNVRKALTSSNTMKSNLGNPHDKQIQVTDVHRLVFSKFFDLQFEINKKKSPIFSLKTVHELHKIFGDSIAKPFNSGDLALIVPWYVFQSDENVNTTEHPYLSPGTLMIPIREVDTGVVEFFIPSSGLDPETNEVPDHFREMPLSIVLPTSFSLKHLYPLRKKGEGKCTLYKGMSFTSIVSKQIKENDFFICHGQWLEVYAVGEDAFYPPGTRDAIRFKKDSERNANKQKFEILSLPKLQGITITLPIQSAVLHKSVDLQLVGVDCNNMGTLMIYYKNACFNSLGFLTHDTHIFL